jgi:multidrug resistance efflux pump
MFAKATAKRRQNLLISVAHTRSMFEVAKREFDQVTAQLHDLETTHSDQLSAA